LNWRNDIFEAGRVPLALYGAAVLFSILSTMVLLIPWRLPALPYLLALSGGFLLGGAVLHVQQVSLRGRILQQALRAYHATWAEICKTPLDDARCEEAKKTLKALRTELLSPEALGKGPGTKK